MTVRTEVDPAKMTFPSVTPFVPACVWGERELRDMFGLIPEGLPDRRRLVLPDDWPSGLYPLRKDSMDYRFRPAPASDMENYEFLADTKGKETTLVPMGPLHITSDEPGHFRLFVEGETIVDADYRLFYVHRGMEKVAETRLNYDAVTFLADRICGICGCAHSVAYAEAVERAQGIHVPPRAQYIRAIMLEVERLHSHLLNIGLASHYTGFDSGFQQFFRVREKSMDLAEKLSGHRKTYGLNVIGGVRRDILAEQKLSTLTTIHQLRSEVQELVDVLLSTPNFIERTSGIGILDRKIARDFSPVGPLMRGSGYARDVRFDHPFDGYADPDVKRCMLPRQTPAMPSAVPPFASGGLRFDRHDRDHARELPVGPHPHHGLGVHPAQVRHRRHRAPRGEDVHWAMLGNNQKCYRWRAKAATYSNWPVLRYMFRGNTVGDAALIVGSLDPCYSCTDRVTVTDVAAKRDHVLDKEQFENVWRDKSPLAGEGTMAAPLDEGGALIC